MSENGGFCLWIEKIGHKFNNRPQNKIQHISTLLDSSRNMKFPGKLHLGSFDL